MPDFDIAVCMDGVAPYQTIQSAVDLAPLGAALKWEPSRGGDLFPHLFAPLPARTDAPQRGLSVDADGVMRFEDGAIGWP